MNATAIPFGYVPLLDAAPLILAHEMGFAGEEGIALDLRQAASWSSLRDMLSFGQVDAAHMLAPVPIAQALGASGPATPLCAVSVLSVNGTVIGVGPALASRIADQGHGFAFDDPMAASLHLRRAASGPLRVGVPFPFSMHAELVRYWLESTGWDLDRDLDLHTIPPPMMGAALAAGEIDAFCVGEPWGTHAVATQDAHLLLSGAAIWRFAPEKVLAVRRDWADGEAFLLHRLIRATWRAGRWLSQPDNLSMAAELLARPQYLGLDPVAIEMSLAGRLTISPDGQTRTKPRFITFHEGVANFPWRSQAQWIAARMAARLGIAPDDAQQAAFDVFRPDLFRQAMGQLTTDLPGASQKLEGALDVDTAVASARGEVILRADGFFDGQIFEPHLG